MTWWVPFHFHALMNPWFLLLLVPVVALFSFESLARAPGVMRISTGETLARFPGAHRRFTRRLPALLRAGGLSFLVLALARPMTGLEVREDRTDVVDIMLCVDVSGSMKAIDFMAGGRRMDRLTVTKEAVREFIASRKQTDEDRFGLDRIGLILYAGYAWTQCPLTLDYGILERELDLAHIDESDSRKEGTAIGSAIGLAVSRLRKSEARSKIIILVTDGLNNRGELEPLTAAGLAKEYGIRIYAIGAGSRSEVLIPQQTLFGQHMVARPLPIDDEGLRKIATLTGGQYYRATETDALHGAYAEISRLEATEVQVGDFYDYEDGFLPYLLIGSAFLGASILSRRQWFDPIP
ncbi:MAG: VWA domain-containing protein [Candidatus Hydrogenedentes bacterium]|nr:VWA domain-containing protein [Candidatus Hydrogenedentota bacterium]